MKTQEDKNKILKREEVKELTYVCRQTGKPIIRKVEKLSQNLVWQKDKKIDVNKVQVNKIPTKPISDNDQQAQYIEITERIVAKNNEVLLQMMSQQNAVLNSVRETVATFVNHVMDSRRSEIGSEHSERGGYEGKDKFNNNAVEATNENVGTVTKKDLLTLIKKEVHEINKEGSKDKEFTEEMRNTLKIFGKGVSLKRDYKLTISMKYKYFIDLLRSEMREYDLLHVIDPKVTVNKEFSEEMKEKQEHRVRDIIINRIDMNYHSKVINLTNPKEILEKIRNLKRSELNTNSLTIRTKLYDMRYVPGKMKASEFWDKFEDLIREYESLPDVPPLSELEKRDAMYKPIKGTVPSVKNAEFLTKTQTGKGLSYEQLKFYVIQDEADNDIGYNARAVFHTNRGVSKERCYGCDDVGHIHAHCPRSDGKKKCYSCSDFVSDI